MQDALVTAWRELASLRDPGAFDAWLTRILVNRCRRGLRAGDPRDEPGDTAGGAFSGPG